MAQIMTAPTESEALVETLATTQPFKQIWRDMNLVRSPNGDHPDVSSTISRQEADEDDSWESEGWRYIETTTEVGEITYERVPLTPYELLHPKEGYVIVHKSLHDKNTTYIGTTVGTHLAHNPKASVFGDLRTDFNLPGVEPVSPDISVVFDAPQKESWSTFKCQEEGVYPSVIFEVTSPGTRQDDFGKKYDYYRRAGVPYYVILDIIYDKDDQPLGYELFVYELSDHQYTRCEPGYLGRYWLPPLDIWVDLGEKGILCYDAAGNLLMNHEELAHALNESEMERNAAQELADEQRRIAEQEREFAQQEAVRAAVQERIAQQEAVRAAEQERIAQQEAARADEQERIAQQEATRAVEQERIAQQEATRAAEQERIAEQERELAQQEAARAAEQERIASEALQAQQAAEAKIVELLARMAELESKS